MLMYFLKMRAKYENNAKRIQSQGYVQCKPSLALDSSIHAGMTIIWLEQYIPADFLL
jgi:hypothetical protein